MFDLIPNYSWLLLPVLVIGAIAYGCIWEHNFTSKCEALGGTAVVNFYTSPPGICINNAIKVPQ